MVRSVLQRMTDLSSAAGERRKRKFETFLEAKMSCLGFFRSQCDIYWLRDAGTRLAGVAVALRIDSNVKYWFVAPAGSRWTRGRKIPFFSWRVEKQGFSHNLRIWTEARN